MRFSGAWRTTDQELPRPAGRISAVALAMVIVLALTLVGPAFGASFDPALCAADPSWVTSPDPPQEIPGGGTDLCEFYQFAWQWFLYLVSPSSSTAGADRNFEVQASFPLLQAKATDSCTTTSNEPVLFVRTLKSRDPDGPFTVPTDTGQAGTDSAVIYDKNGNTVFYQVRFSRNLCPKPSPPGDLPVGTTELKTAWRIIDKSEAPRYYTNETVIQGVSTEPVLLGLIGFHLFRTTAEHPEGVWMTWEHKSNDPECLFQGAGTAFGWSFTSPNCSNCLSVVRGYNGPPACAKECNFNSATVSASLIGIPSQICRVFHDGTRPTDPGASENVAVVDTLNSQLNGPNGILTGLPADSALAVFANYEQIGGLWLSDPSKPSSHSSNQRGSLQLANSVMETTFQGTFDAKVKEPPTVEDNSVVNCFGCHSYTPNETLTSGLSHIIEHLHPSLVKASSGGGAAVVSMPSHRPSAGGGQ